MSPRPKSSTVRKKSAAPAAAAPTRKNAARGVAFDIGTLVREVRDLRSLRGRYNELLKEHHGLLGTLKDLSAELGTSARRAWSNYRGTDAGSAGSGLKTRVRTASGDVDTQYDKMVQTLPSAWTSKSDICKGAGLGGSDCNTAFRRLVTGYKRGGKSYPALLESNGKRGTEGRYRKK